MNCTIDDLSKIELTVATVTAAEPVEGSEKLLKLQLDTGDGQRQIASGIAKSYTPDQLAGKQVILVANLEPRTVFGVESNGMLLAASGDEGPIILTTERPVTPGASIK